MLLKPFFLPPNYQGNRFYEPNIKRFPILNRETAF